MGGYQAGSLRIRVLQLLHELGHITLNGSFTSNGLPRNLRRRGLVRPGLLLELDGGKPSLSVSNTSKVLKHCRKEIDALPN